MRGRLSLFPITQIHCAHSHNMQHTIQHTTHTPQPLPIKHTFSSSTVLSSRRCHHKYTTVLPPCRQVNHVCGGVCAWYGCMRVCAHSLILTSFLLHVHARYPFSGNGFTFLSANTHNPAATFSMMWGSLTKMKKREKLKIRE